MVLQFHKPATIQEAVGLKRRFQARSAYLAGGTFANAKESPLHPDHWISLAGLEADRIDQTADGLVIGALCSLQQLIDDTRTPPPLRAAAAQIVSRNVRHAATIGGHVAANLPHSDLLPMLVALEAQVELVGFRTARTVSVLDYVSSAGAHRVAHPVTSRTNRLSASVKNGLITRVIVPRLDRNRAAGCGNIRGSANARSLLSVAVSLTLAGDGIDEPIIALAGVAPHVARLISAEQVLHGRPLPPTDQLEAMISRCVGPASTPFAGAPYLKHQVGVVVANAFRSALQPRGDQ